MSLHYSPSQGFIDGGALPSDAQAIDPGMAAVFRDAIARGLSIDPAAIQRATVVASNSTDELARMRWLRDRLLAGSDWTQLPDALTDQLELKAAWSTYRQALRDLDFGAGVFPEPPGPNSQSGEGS